MSQTKHEILALLAEAGTEPRHRFGQNFMIDQNLVRIVAEAGNVKPGDLVIEVGPGTGTLTDELLARVAPNGRVVAVEIDRDLAGLLRTRFAGRKDFTLIEGDALAGKHLLNAELLAVLNARALLFPPSVRRRSASEGVLSSNTTAVESAALPGSQPRSMTTDHDKHVSACHPERSEGSLPSAAEETLRCAQGDGYSRQFQFQSSSTKGGRKTSFAAEIHPPPISGSAEETAASGSVKLVANLPYNIASPLVIELLIAGVGQLAFTVQKEVADRLRAAAGSDDYGPLTAMAQLLSRVQVLRTLPPQAFWPAPKIDSALVCLIRDDRLGPEANGFGVFVLKLFSFRRKTLRKALTLAGLEAAALLAATGFDGQLRPETFTPGQLLQLYFAAQRRDAAPLSRAIIEGSSNPAISSSTASEK